MSEWAEVDVLSDMTEPIVFAGPSACELPAAARAGATWLPPVRRGDIDLLLRTTRAPAVLVVCDGVFGGHPAVSHAELCRAIDAGWQLWGVSSLGAIRAHEMRSEGMHGFGYVHEQFARFEDFTDDEMCLLHVPEPPYYPVTEALVNLRYALEHPAAPRIAASAQVTLLAALSALWFGDRSADRIRRIMVNEAGIAAATADALLAWTRAHRIKGLDLADLLAARPWLRAPAPAP